MQRTALITGATQGIGRAIAKQLVQSGFRVFVTGRSATALNSLCQELNAPGVAFDLTPPEAPIQLYQSARSALGAIDVLVNNAGFNKAKTPLPDIQASDLDESFAVNVRAPILLAREALREMGARGTGHIVNIISSVVHFRAENYSVYTTMKHALHGFTGSLIKEARAMGVKVTGIYPGGTNTGFRAQPRPDYLRPESVATMVVQCITAPPDVVVHELTFRPMVESNF